MVVLGGGAVSYERGTPLTFAVENVSVLATTVQGLGLRGPLALSRSQVDETQHVNLKTLWTFIRENSFCFHSVAMNFTTQTCLASNIKAFV